MQGLRVGRSLEGSNAECRPGLGEGVRLAAQEEEAESESGCGQRRAGDPRVGDSVGGNGAEQERRGQAPMVFAKGSVED